MGNYSLGSYQIELIRDPFGPSQAGWVSFFYALAPISQRSIVSPSLLE
jgi:hypothetical protein